MIMIKRTAHNDGVEFIIYLCYVDDVLIHQERVDDANRYQTLKVLAPTGKDILIKERVYYSDDDYQESEKLVKYQVGNIHKCSIIDITPVNIELDGTTITSSYKDTLTVDTGDVKVVTEKLSTPTTITSDPTGELTTTHDVGIYSVATWADTDYGDSAISHIELDPYTKEVFTDEDSIPASIIGGEDHTLPHQFSPTGRCEIHTLDDTLIATLYPGDGSVTIPARYLKHGHKIIITIFGTGISNISRVVSILNPNIRDGEIPTGKVSLYKMTNELKVLPDGNDEPLDREFYRLTDGDIDPHNMTKLRLDGYESYDDTLYSVADSCLYRYNGINMSPLSLLGFTRYKLPADSRFAVRRADGTYFVASKNIMKLYTNSFQIIRYYYGSISYSSGGYFFSSEYIFYIEGILIKKVPLPPILRSYIPTYTQYGFIHFIATNDTPNDLPKHMGINLTDFSLLPLGEPDISIKLLTDGNVTHTCIGLDGDPLIVSNNNIYKYDIASKKYSRLVTVPGAVVAFYRLDDYIIIKTGNGQHYRLVMDT